MTRFEKKILDLLTAHRVVLAYVVITALNLYLRKVAVWWNAEGIECYYDGHSHMVQGQLWWLIMRLGMLFPILPVHFMKWVATVGDYAMAGAGAVLISSGAGKGSEKKSDNGAVRDLGRKNGENSSVRGLAFYAVVLIMPFTLMRGIVWGLADSLGIACVLIGTLLYRALSRGRSGKCALAARTLAYVLALLFSPVLIIPFCIEGIVACYKKDSKKAGVIACSILCAAILAGILGIINGFGFAEGLLGQVNFIKYEALSGEAFAGVKVWVMAQAQNFVFPVVTLGTLHFCHPVTKMKRP